MEDRYAFSHEFVCISGHIRHTSITKYSYIRMIVDYIKKKTALFSAGDCDREKLTVCSLMYPCLIDVKKMKLEN